MNDLIRAPAPTLGLVAGLDRALAWNEGGSVRYLVVDLTAQGSKAAPSAAPPLNLALAIDVSGSMDGDKLVAARHTAAAVAKALGSKDRLTLVAFAGEATLLLDAVAMGAAGRAKAIAAIDRLRSGGNTDLSAGWLLAAERLATVMPAMPRASHRLLLLSDGHVNGGIIDPAELARHAGELLARGIVTSMVGIGDGYDEALLGAMAEAGGGRLHDAEHAAEIAEVVLGELREGRGAALERVRLRVTLPASLRAEVIGPWAHVALPGALDVLVGTLLPDRLRRVVVRLHCAAGRAGDVVLLGVAAEGVLPDGSAAVGSGLSEVELRLAGSAGNNAQLRDPGRSQAAMQAWHAMVLRKAVQLNREQDRTGARHFLERELQWIERYARGLPDTATPLAELALLLRRVDQDWGERTRKEVYAAANQRGRYEADLRSAPREPLADRLRREQP